MNPETSTEPCHIKFADYPKPRISHSFCSPELLLPQLNLAINICQKSNFYASSVLPYGSMLSSSSLINWISDCIFWQCLIGGAISMKSLQKRFRCIGRKRILQPRVSRFSEPPCPNGYVRSQNAGVCRSSKKCTDSCSCLGASTAMKPCFRCCTRRTGKPRPILGCGFTATAK